MASTNSAPGKLKNTTLLVMHCMLAGHDGKTHYIYSCSEIGTACFELKERI